MDMPLFILGVVIGGLSLWIYMRERVLRLEAQIEAALTKKKVEAAQSPPVKKRKVGEGDAAAKAKAAESEAEESEAEESEAEESEAEESEAEESEASEAEESEAEESEAEESEAEESEADDAEDEESESGEEAAAASDVEEESGARKKPKVDIKIPEPSSVSEVSSSEEE